MVILVIEEKDIKQDLGDFADDNTLKSCFCAIVVLFVVVAQPVFFLILH